MFLQAFFMVKSGSIPIGLGFSAGKIMSKIHKN
jgi:hypothetical protein